MKKVDFDKNIKIYSIANNHYQGLILKSILYTPIPYRIPVAFADATNSIDDTEKYIKDTYSKEEQEAIAYNNKINTEFWNELLKLKNPSEKETINLSKKYQGKLSKDRMVRDSSENQEPEVPDVSSIMEAMQNGERARMGDKPSDVGYGINNGYGALNPNAGSQTTSGANGSISKDDDDDREI